MSDVFVVMHEVSETDERCQDVKMIGVYGSQSEAEKAVQRLRNKEGFVDFQDGFSIDRFQINKDSWSEGFFSYSSS